MTELTLKMSDGFLIYAFIRKPEGKPVGHIHLLHGMAEHMGRYETSVQFLVERGYVVSGHDHRGHGKTVKLNGIEGHFADNDGFNRVVEDVFEVLTSLKANESPLKFILMGHSMGSFVARRFIQLHGDTVDQVVLSGTGDDSGLARYAGLAAADVFGRKNGFKERNEFLYNLIFGGFNKGIKNPLTKFDWISQDLNLVVSYMTDDNCGFVPTTQFFVDLFDGLGLIHKKKEITKIPPTLPILLFSGARDPVGHYGKAVWKVAQQYNDAGIEDVTVLLFEGGRHEILNDVTRREVITGVLDWVEKR